MRSPQRSNQTIYLGIISVGESASPRRLERVRQYQQEYRGRPEVRKRMHELAARYYNKNRSLALSIVANGLPRCALEDDTCKGLLDIDHMLGNGNEERAIRSHTQFYADIVSGIRKTSDLRVLCRSHNLRER